MSLIQAYWLFAAINTLLIITLGIVAVAQDDEIDVDLSEFCGLLVVVLLSIIGTAAIAFLVIDNFRDRTVIKITPKKKRN
jgi:uncharacterized membrane protein YhaH (DUF805 family)